MRMRTSTLKLAAYTGPVGHNSNNVWVTSDVTDTKPQKKQHHHNFHVMCGEMTICERSFCDNENRSDLCT